MDELIMIEQKAKLLTEQTCEILEKNFPLDSREFLNQKDLEVVKKNDNEIVLLAQQYLELFKKLPLEEQRNYMSNYKNIQGNYYQTTHNVKGLIRATSNDDEYELRKAFQKATEFGLKSLDDLHLASKTNDENLKEKGQHVLNVCKNILGVHFWGEDRIEYLNRYEKRLASGRTVENDLEDYKLLIQETKLLSVEYAKEILNGISKERIKEYSDKFEEIFSREKALTEFVPMEILSEIKVNLHWMKVDAERKPETVVSEFEEIKTGLKMK